MPVFSSLDPDFLDRITTEGMQWVQIGAHDRGIEAGAIVTSTDPQDESAGVIIIARVPPGGSMPRHAHAAFRVEIQLQGSMDVGGGHVLHPGDISISAPGEFYGPNIAGPEGSMTAEFISSIDGIGALLFEGDATPEQKAMVEEAREHIQGLRAKAKASATKD